MRWNSIRRPPNDGKRVEALPMSLISSPAPTAAQRVPSVCWGRLPKFCQHYDCEKTIAYSWLAAGRVHSRKLGGLRIWEIGTVRGIDNDAPPEPSWAIPAAARSENQGR